MINPEAPSKAPFTSLRTHTERERETERHTLLFQDLSDEPKELQESSDSEADDQWGGLGLGLLVCLGFGFRVCRVFFGGVSWVLGGKACSAGSARCSAGRGLVSCVDRAEGCLSPRWKEERRAAPRMDRLARMEVDLAQGSGALLAPAGGLDLGLLGFC